MKKPDKLFQLIKSLTKTEKRYFKLLASPQKGGKQYMRLFDAIDAQEEYDEAALSREFAGERLLKQLNVAKNYLYELILRSLRTYHAQHGTEARILELLRTSFVLHEKGLDDQATEAARKAARLAERHEEFALLLRANVWRYKTFSERCKTREGIEDYYAEQFRALERERDMLEQARLLDLLAVHFLSPTGEKVWAEEEGLEEIINGMADRATSVKADLLWNWSFSLYHSERDEFYKAIHYNEQQLILLESNPHILNDYPLKYILILHNLGMAYRLMGNEAKFWETLERTEEAARKMLSEAPWRAPRIRHGIFNAAYLHRFIYFVRAGKYEHAAEMVPNIEEGLREYELLIEPSDQMIIRTRLAGLSMACGDTDRAIFLLHELMNGEGNVIGTPVEAQVRFMYIIAHFEGGNIDLIESLVRSAYRSLRSRGELTLFESTMLRRLRRLALMSPTHPDATILTKWHQELEAIANDPVEVLVTAYFDVATWIESKLLKSPMAPIAARKFRQEIEVVQ